MREKKLRSQKDCSRRKALCAESWKTNVTESKYSLVRAYLLQSIEVLKEGLDSLRIQKHEVAKNFEGEKNAMELSFKRKEDELRQQLRLELQRKMILAKKQWARTEI